MRQFAYNVGSAQDFVIGPSGAQEPFFNRGSRSKIKFYHVTLVFTHPLKSCRLLTPYVNAGTWSLMY